MNINIKERIEDNIRNNPFVSHLGITVIEVKEGYIKAEMPLRSEEKQYSGTVHGGVLASIADTIAGYAAYTVTDKEAGLLTTDLDIKFLRSGWGDKLVAIGRSVKSGRRMQFGECEVYCNNKLMCKASGSFLVIEPKK
ncbi:MAG: PaaI family thioesterase [Bacteroidales bacterium]|nr:PaaI family thioesterase [Bacteroidales bacterium]